jgi:hypothetical protein
VARGAFVCRGPGMACGVPAPVRGGSHVSEQQSSWCGCCGPIRRSSAGVPMSLKRLPDGQIAEPPVQPPLQKYSGSLQSQITSTSIASRPARGTYRDRHGRWVRDAMDAACQARSSARTNDIARGRRSRVVLTPRRWRQVLEKQSFLGMTVANKPGHRGEREISC